jgi:hypothetical protein
MEAPPHPICFFCNIADATPKMELACQHRVHTACFLTRLHNEELECPECAQVIYTFFEPHNHQEQEETNEITKLYNEDAQFRTNILAYVKSLREVSKSDNQMKKLIKQRKTLYTDEIQTIKNRLKEIQKYEIKRVKMSEQYKTYLKNRRRSDYLLNHIHPTKVFPARKLRRVLKGKPKLKSWPLKYRHFRYSSIDRHFYFRINI